MPTENKITAPEESAGVDFGIDGRSVRVSQDAYSIFLAREAAGREKVAALQQRLTAADERADVLEGLLRTSLLAMSRIYEAGRDFIVGTGSDCDSVELMMENDPTVREIRAALKPAEGGGDD